MTIYLDMIFIENMIINFLIIYSTSKILKIKANLARAFIASFLAAIYSIMYYIAKINLYSNFIIKILLSILIIYVSFNAKNFKTLIKQIIIFYLVTFVFAGGTLGIIYMVNSGKITIRDGVLVGNYTIKTVFIGIIIGFIIITTGFKIAKTKISNKDLICNILVYLNGIKIKTKAIIDTGNFLKEPITNIPVAVVEHTLLYNAIPIEILDNIENVLGGDFRNIPIQVQQEYISRLRVIPFSSLGKQNGMLLGIKADKIIIENNESYKQITKVIIGIYNKSITKKGEYHALVGLWAN